MAAPRGIGTEEGSQTFGGVVEQTGSLEAAYAVAAESIIKAQESLAEIPDGQAKKALLWLAERVIQTHKLK